MKTKRIEEAMKVEEQMAVASVLCDGCGSDETGRDWLSNLACPACGCAAGEARIDDE